MTEIGKLTVKLTAEVDTSQIDAAIEKLEHLRGMLQERSAQGFIETAAERQRRHHGSD